MSNLKIERKSISNGSCNLCKRGVQVDGGNGLVYPYNEIVEIQGNHNCSLVVRFCDRCLREVNDYLNDKGDKK